MADSADVLPQAPCILRGCAAHCQYMPMTQSSSQTVQYVPLLQLP